MKRSIQFNIYEQKLNTVRYDLYPTKSNKIDVFLECTNKSNYLKRNLQNFLKTEKSDLLKDDPTDPYTWGDGKKKKNLKIQKMANYICLI